MSNSKLKVVTSDGHRFEISCYGETTAKKVLLFFPAMGIEARYYRVWAQSLADSGVLCCIADLRGHGSSNVRARRGIDFGYHSLIEQDYQSAINAVLKYAATESLFLGGHSLGGQLSCLYAATRQEQQRWLSGLLLIGSCTISHKGWSGYKGFAMRLVPHLFSLIVKMLGFFPGYKLNFAGKEARQQILDWAQSGIMGMYKPAGYKNTLEPLMKKIQVPLIALSFEYDHYAPKAAVENLLSKMSGCQIIRTHLTADQFPCEILDHFKWARINTTITASIVNQGLTDAALKKTSTVE